jgi:predicted DsbA family dithiol-disulfide isomerase
VPTLDPNGEYLHRAWSTSVYPMAERMGITMKLPPVQPRSRLAHESAHWARSLGRFDDYNAAVFRAFFERGEDIGQIPVLVRLASDLGMDDAALRAALSNQQFRESVMTDERDAVTLGVSGVPAFIANRRIGSSGVQPLDELRNLLARARAEL